MKTFKQLVEATEKTPEHHQQILTKGYKYSGGTKLGFKHWKDVYEHPSKESITVQHNNGAVTKVFKGDSPKASVQDALRA